MKIICSINGIDGVGKTTQVDLFRDKYVMSFVYGFICHYVLDSSIHPYVEFKTGRFNPRDKKTYKYNAKHHEMETYIDAYMLRKHGIEPRKDKSYKYIFKNGFSKCDIYDMEFLFHKPSKNFIDIRSLREIRSIEEFRQFCSKLEEFE